MSEQIKVSHTLDQDVIAAIEALAEADNRSRSNMIEVLIQEALESRREASVAG